MNYKFWFYIDLFLFLLNAFFAVLNFSYGNVSTGCISAAVAMLMLGMAFINRRWEKRARELKCETDRMIRKMTALFEQEQSNDS